MDQASPSKDSDNNNFETEKLATPLDDANLLHSDSTKASQDADDEGETFDCRYCANSFQTNADRLKHEHGHRPAKSPRYKCDVCPESFTKQCLLKHHRESHFGGKPFKQHKCDICLKDFTRKDHLTRHMRRIHMRNKSPETFSRSPAPVPKPVPKPRHMGSPPHKCRYCSHEFESHSDLQQHEIIHTRGKTYVCEYCGKNFSQKGTLMLHEMEKHMEDSAFADDSQNKNSSKKSGHTTHGRPHHAGNSHPCEKCNEAFATEANLNKHMASHSDNSPSCSLCNRQFTSQAGLKKHTQIKHSGTEAVECHTCKMSFADIGQFEEHQRKNKGDCRPFKCNDCNATYKYKQGLRQHRVVHGDKVVQCDQCDKTFTRTANLRRHLDTNCCKPNFNPEHKCDQCEASYKDKEDLDQHISKHHDIVYKCTTCQQTFSDLRSRKRHNANRSLCAKYIAAKEPKKDEVYKCTDCKESFDDIISLGVHNCQVVEGTHKCSYCHMCFENSESLKEHEEKHLEEKASRMTQHGGTHQGEDHQHSGLDEGDLKEGDDSGSEEESASFPCELCDLTFSSQSSLNIHQDSHNMTETDQHKLPSGLYSCNVCQKGFESHSECLNHEKLHLEDSLKEEETKGFTCGYCCMTFSSKATLKTHMDSHTDLDESRGGDYTSAKSSPDATPKKGTAKSEAISPTGSDGSVTKTRTGRTVVTPARFRQDVVMNSLESEESDFDDENMEDDSDKDVGKNNVRISRSTSKKKTKAAPVTKRSPDKSRERLGNKDKEIKGKETSNKRSSTGNKQSPKRSLQTKRKDIIYREEENKFRCELCPSTFPKELALQKHQIVHTRKGKFQCLKCTASFNFNMRLIDHERVHTGIFLKCTYCPKTFIYADSFKRHVLLHRSQKAQNGRKQYRLRQSNGHQKRDNIKTEENAEASPGEETHLKQTDVQRDDTKQEKRDQEDTSASPPVAGRTCHKCEVCPTSFHTQLALLKHQQVHSKDKFYECTECTSVFTEFEKFEKHTEKHLIKCRYCSRSFTKLTNLKAHSKIHKRCARCPRTFTSVQALKAHTKVHAKRVSYPCHYCKKSFLTVGSLVIHENLHKRNLNSKFYCQYCAQAFNTKGNALRHERIHTQEKPYSYQE